ncbi:peptide deformylase [Devosia nitrariae]|uniref:Peptide deformylase n=1 Tax=Devosia nitrariae TaxID=2071872 RepID=A0ABQ5W762_9HYPH|nr:peptide deformylase [Devosia nitrariae]GLQ55717.1 peptide deformylase [Devosia nitrariae]
MPDEPILPIDDPLLKRPSEVVTRFDDELRALSQKMFEVMDKAKGAGLAAVQIGVPRRLVVMDVRDNEDRRHRLTLVNPELLVWSDDMVRGVEGCLSMPDYTVPVDRSARVRVRYQDLSGEVHETDADGEFAVCLQHEIDHTNGILFTDRVSRLRRDKARKHFARVRRDAERGHAIV